MCEGRDEYGYLRGARSAFRVPQANVVIESCDGGGPRAIVAAAVAARDRYATAGDEGRFDAAWVVLDAEKAATSGIRDAVRTARRENVRVALSNPSFEVWLLLHRAPQGAHLSAADAKRRCREHFGIPRRNGRRPAFDDPRLGSGWEIAAENARQGRAALSSELRLSSAVSHELVLAVNPSSNVDELLAAIRRARAGYGSLG